MPINVMLIKIKSATKAMTVNNIIMIYKFNFMAYKTKTWRKRCKFMYVNYIHTKRPIKLSYKACSTSTTIRLQISQQHSTLSSIIN